MMKWMARPDQVDQRVMALRLLVEALQRLDVLNDLRSTRVAKRAHGARWKTDILEILIYDESFNNVSVRR
jgi:hypothetical protein